MLFLSRKHQLTSNRPGPVCLTRCKCDLYLLKTELLCIDSLLNIYRLSLRLNWVLPRSLVFPCNILIKGSAMSTRFSQICTLVGIDAIAYRQSQARVLRTIVLHPHTSPGRRGSDSTAAGWIFSTGNSTTPAVTIYIQNTCIHVFIYY